MAWETRNGRGRYYTRSKRVNGRVIREYVGSGPLGEIAARLDEERRQKRQEEGDAWSRHLEELEAIEGAVDRFTRGVSDVSRSILQASGFHRHNRGEWRRKRG